MEIKNMTRPKELTVQEIILHLTEGITLPENTVDQLITGSPDQFVTGIVVAFMPTQQVIEQAIQGGANLIIAHESPFYNHHSATDWLVNNSVYTDKRTLIDQAGIALFRCHDIIHRFEPDGITDGLIQELGWTTYLSGRTAESDIVTFPEGMTVQEIAQHLKQRLGIDYVRIAGNSEIVCRRAAVLVGFRGNGPVTIPLLQNEQVDLIIAGEGFEWETPEYVRDAVQQGKSKALIMVGHAESEAPGMKLLADRLEESFPETKITFVKEQPVFKVF
ncbi:Putative GTP cyclohydrolase 1 type 2, NIF3 family [Paenibacillus polysaccharolyticus]|uniref:GTP cyclohydrolase 1 type 2 homolog n=1 Tax=Paenibacillus polysaccharolyticus TaxID=582692 RepID=A0A1G5KZB3_9BACL|nr:Nif3-like dinuclear metal center hexameric protein [Paenibacillus polysaccharolyticus]SCZ05947.1 Putative GTP cyclohydrolase 1 type 2, NIF3 family [Paenibacillus polysaccharolyticus]